MGFRTHCLLGMACLTLVCGCSRIGFQDQSSEPLVDATSGNGNNNGNGNIGSGNGNNNGNGTILAPSIPVSKIYWAEQCAIKRANLDGSGVETLVTSGVDHPDSLVLDIPGNKMYWTDDGNNTIRRANLDGTQAEILAESPFATDPHGLVLDKTTDSLYWGDHTQDRIQWIQLSDLYMLNAYTCFGTADDDVMAMVLDPSTRMMYFLTNCQKALHGFDVDTVYKQMNLQTLLSDPVGLALDATAGYLYYTECGKISRCRLDGSSPTTLISASGRQNGIALDLAGGKMYWTDSTAHRIKRANLDGTLIEDVLTTGGNAQGIALDLR